LKNTLDAIPPTVWECLWLSDIDKLEEQVNQAKSNPMAVKALYMVVESNARIVQKCGFVT
jgi:hypothetical protein